MCSLIPRLPLGVDGVSYFCPSNYQADEALLRQWSFLNWIAGNGWSVSFPSVSKVWEVLSGQMLSLSLSHFSMRCGRTPVVFRVVRMRFFCFGCRVNVGVFLSRSL